MILGDLHKVWEIKALKRKPGEEEAKKNLEKIAKQVQPIMRKHKWRVKLLSEFCLNNPTLLGLNVGAGIHILACEDQIIKKALLGVTGGSQDVPIYGFTIKHYLCGKGRAYVIAMATEKRLQDDIWCGSYCSDIVRDEESYADTLQDHLDLDQGGERLSINNVSSRHAFGGTSLKRSHGPGKPQSSFVDLTTPPVSRSSINEGAKYPKRSCKSNNLIPHQSSSSATSSAPMLNDDSPENQGLCCMERSRDSGTKYKFWSCKFCTLENSVKLDKCSACDQWRYSHESHFGAN
ncbi:hypothetical protein ES288_A01G154000v1 [Gossypium darwinii]|uniref:RanBP2-type domain-containing protein n=2 Tax=Gossypium TaxID=3633 RepID=A0A5D2RS78_GOSTO|nr:hypothetical protein ES288_A01G154000v1 [Gossypium darwinii]TYI43333.1 hypothetical protein ES332_A01G161500v1 [Gossypium tomentosum]